MRCGGGGLGHRGVPKDRSHERGIVGKDSSVTRTVSPCHFLLWENGALSL